jgi:ADP-heptose:LPS heptosyltransferase
MQRWTFKRVVCLKRDGAIGDVLWLTSLARHLKEAHPQWELFVDSPFPDLFEGNPILRPIGEGIGESYETIPLDFAYERHPKMHIVAGYMQEVDPKHQVAQGAMDVYPPELYLKPMEKTVAELQLKDPVCVIHPDRTGWPGRDWEEEKWEHLVRWLQKRTQFDVWQVGKMAPMIPGVRRLHADRRSMMAVMSKAKLFIGIDSFPSVVACALGVRSVVLFGSIFPGYRLVRRRQRAVMGSEWLKCLGCHHEHPPPVTVSGCVRSPDVPIAPCMESIQVGDVIQEILFGQESRHTVRSRVPEEAAGVRRTQQGARAHQQVG